MGPYGNTAGDEGDKVGQGGLKPDVAKRVQAALFQDEKSRFNAIGSYSSLWAREWTCFAMTNLVDRVQPGWNRSQGSGRLLQLI